MAVVPFDGEANLRNRTREHAEMLCNQCMIVAYLVYRSGEDDATGVQKHHVVGKIESKFDVLLDEKDRLSLLLQARNDTTDLGDDQGCKALGRLVHQQHARIAHQCAADGKHLLLAPGKRAGVLELSLLQRWKELEHAIQRPGSFRSLPRLLGDKEVFAHGEAPEDASSLRYEAHALA